MSLTAQIFGRDSLIFKGANLGTLGIAGYLDRKMNPDADPTVQRLGDISQQTAKEGDPRTIVWGRVRPIGGNIIHCQKPIKRWVVTSTSSGGKGGGKKKQEQKTEHVYRTYAIGVCEGPITAFSRIWRNNKLVYDGRGTAWGARNNGVFLRSFRLYLGGWAQMPDPTLQSIWGAGNVPAYRGTAYMVSIDEDLTDQGGMVPQWQFEVERAEGIFYTSKPYAAEDDDSADGDISIQRLRDPFYRQAKVESFDGSISIDSLSVRNTNIFYEHGDSSDGDLSVQAMSFRNTKQVYSYGSESIDGSLSAQSMVFRVGKIIYIDPAWPESCDGSISIQGMSHASA